jgi:hypothetical protein
MQNKNTELGITSDTKIEGNAQDLVSFSVKPGDIVSGVFNFEGVVKGAYFFEGNIGINILDANKKVLKQGYAMSTTDWMTTEAVSFSGSIDLTGLPSGSGFIEIAKDNPSDMRELDKFIYIPVVIGQSKISSTYTYKNHGFTIELPKGFVPTENESEAGPSISISLPVWGLSYVTDASWWEKHVLPDYKYFYDEKIGETTFKVYGYGESAFYWFKQGNVGYEFHAFGEAPVEFEQFKNMLKTFKFVGWVTPCTDVTGATCPYVEGKGWYP